jgi:hypothetical protein
METATEHEVFMRVINPWAIVNMHAVKLDSFIAENTVIVKGQLLT